MFRFNKNNVLIVVIALFFSFLFLHVLKYLEIDLEAIKKNKSFCQPNSLVNQSKLHVVNFFLLEDTVTRQIVNSNILRFFHKYNNYDELNFISLHQSNIDKYNINYLAKERNVEDLEKWQIYSSDSVCKAHIIKNIDNKNNRIYLLDKDFKIISFCDGTSRRDADSLMRLIGQLIY